MDLAIGDFAVAGQPLVSLNGSQPVDERTREELNRCYSFDQQRTIEQDAAFGVQQIVDVGLKALSPGINDQSTAILCIDRLTEILVRVARRRIENRYRYYDGQLRVIAIGPTFGDLVRVAFRDLRDAAATKPAVLERLCGAFERLSAATTNSMRRAVLREEAARVQELRRRSAGASLDEASRAAGTRE